MTTSVPIPVYRPSVPRGWQQELEAVVESRWWGYGPRCHALEREFLQARTGWALATNSCTSALYVVGRCLAVSPAGEVIVPAMTFASTAMALHEAGLHVRFADVDPLTLMLDVQSAASCITPATVAIVTVHLYGQAQDLRPLRQLCDKHHLRLIEDCAHRLDARTVTTEADFACFSFNAVKEATAGDGGMLWGRDAQDEDACRSISNLGLTVDTVQRASSACHKSYGYSELGGLKLRLSDLSAAFVHACLGEFHGWHDARRRIVARYDEAFMPLRPGICLLPRNGPGDSCLMYVIRMQERRRERMRRYLAEKGIATSVHYPSLSEHPYLGNGSCPAAERAARELVTLPCFPELSTADQDRVIMTLVDAITSEDL